MYIFLVISTHSAGFSAIFLLRIFIAGTYLGKCAHVLVLSLVGVNESDNDKFFRYNFHLYKLQKGGDFSEISYMKTWKKF